MSTQAGQAVDAHIANGQPRQLCPRLTLETAHDGRIWIYTFAKKPRGDQTSSRTVIDAWVDTMKSHLHDLPPGSTWYRLSDFSQTDMNPSPYFVARLSELAKYRPDLKGHSAFVIPKNPFTQVILNLSRRVSPKHVQVRLFFDQEEALRWLENHLEAVPASDEKAAVA